MKHSPLPLIRQVLSIPTMSFHEEGIAMFVRMYATALGLTVREDRAGNLMVRTGRGAPGVAFTAHMDHPGFEVVATKGRKAIVALWGKVDAKTFAGARVVAYTAGKKLRMRTGRLIKNKTFEGRPLFTLSSPEPLAPRDFGHFDLTSCNVVNGKIYTRAADNLMSVAAILDMFGRLKAAGANVGVAGLFTRGEEAGFLGAFAAMDNGLIPRRTPLIVLECSSARHAKVAIGGGPVIRVGDWQSSYDPMIDRWIADTAGAYARRQKKFRFQRELLPGGRCEACVYIAEGYRTGGIALPLGNYHNQSARLRPAPEFVSTADYEGMVGLMCELACAKKPRENYLREQIKPIRKHYRKLRKKLLKSR